MQWFIYYWNYLLCSVSLYKQCFPHIDVTWEGHPGILMAAQAYLVTQFSKLHFCCLSIWEKICDQLASGQSALDLPLLSTGNRTCSADRDRCSLVLNLSCNSCNANPPIHLGLLMMLFHTSSQVHPVGVMSFCFTLVWIFPSTSSLLHIWLTCCCDNWIREGGIKNARFVFT